MTKREKNPPGRADEDEARSRSRRSRTSTRRLVVFGAISLSVIGTLVAACGLDDSVVVENGQNSGSDATIGADGTVIIPDGATRLPDGEIIFVDAGPDGTPHITTDAADPDDADLSDAAVADGGCASGSFACVVGSSTYCLGDCSSCPSLHSACERTHTCVASCTDCDDKTECFRSGFLGNQSYCVMDPASCSTVGGSRVFCGQVPFFYIDCPGTDQVCVSNACLTCGEGTLTKNATCSPSSNGKCNGAGPACH